MSKKLFTDKEIELLSKNPYIKTISQRGITYSDEFKRIFINEYEESSSTIKIFEDHGFDTDILGKERVYSSGKRWRKSYKDKGIAGLDDTRKDNSGRPREKDLSLKEKYIRMEVQNNLLKAENEILKKLEIMERRDKKK